MLAGTGMHQTSRKTKSANCFHDSMLVPSLKSKRSIHTSIEVLNARAVLPYRRLPKGGPANQDQKQMRNI